MTEFFDNRCDYCGKFCKPADRGVYYGYSTDLDPPDETVFCQKCVDKQLKNPKNVITGCWWIKPNFVTVIEKQKTQGKQ